MSFTPRARVRAALQGKWVDRVPFTIYSRMLPRGDVERRLREEGLTPVERVYIYRIEMPGAHVSYQETRENGLRTVRETISSPVGDVTALRKLDPNYQSWWEVEHYIKRPEDYRVLRFIVEDMVYAPNYEQYRLARQRWGEDGYVFASTGYTPMNHMIYRWMGVERFGLDLHEHPDEVLSLFELLWAKQKQLFRVCAQSPAQVIQYGGNVHQDVVGRHRFQQYYVPCLNEFAMAMHEVGKLALCHMDAPMRRLAPAVAQTGMDVIEAFTPRPDGDMTVRDARQAWPDKILWINFPSSVHLDGAEEVRKQTLQILHDAAPGDRFLIGITEDVPEHRWRDSLSAISQVISEHGTLPLQ